MVKLILQAKTPFTTITLTRKSMQVVSNRYNRNILFLNPVEAKSKKIIHNTKKSSHSMRDAIAYFIIILRELSKNLVQFLIIPRFNPLKAPCIGSPIELQIKRQSEIFDMPEK